MHYYEETIIIVSVYLRDHVMETMTLSQSEIVK